MSEQKIIGYTLVAMILTQNETLSRFTKKIQDLIDKGWEPLPGGFWTEGRWYGQAMIKRAPLTVDKVLEKFAATRQPCLPPAPVNIECPIVMSYDFTGVK